MTSFYFLEGHLNINTVYVWTLFALTKSINIGQSYAELYEYGHINYNGYFQLHDLMFGIHPYTSHILIIMVISNLMFGMHPSYLSHPNYNGYFPT